MSIPIATRGVLVALTSLLFLLFLLLPHVNVTDYVNSTVTSKFVYFSYACAVLFALYSIVLLSGKQLVFSFTKLDILLGLLILYITVNRFFVQDIYGFSIRYMELLGLSVLYVILRSLSLKHYIWIVVAILLSGLIQAVYGNLQLLGFYASNHSGFKMTGSFFNPGPYAGFLCAVWPLALGMYLFRKELVNRNWLVFEKISKHQELLLKSTLECIPLVTIICIALVLPASRSRGAWLAVICSSLLLLELRYAFITEYFKKLSRVKKIGVGCISFVLVLVTVLGIYHFKKGSSDGRLFIWKVSSKIIADHPVFGVGFDRFKAHYMNYQGAYFKEYGDQVLEVFVADNTTYAFNEFLQFFIENGVLGVVILIGIVWSLLSIKVADENKTVFRVAISTLGSLCVFAFFSYPMEILPIKLIGVVVLGVISSVLFEKNSIVVLNKKNRSSRFVSLVVIGSVLILLISKQVSYTNKLAKGFRVWNEALDIYKYGFCEGAVDAFKKIDTVFDKNGEFLGNYAKALAMWSDDNEQVLIFLENSKKYVNNPVLQISLGDAYKGLKEYNKAELAYENAYYMIPSRFYPMYLLANFYDEINQPFKAINIAKTVLQKRVKVPSKAIEEIKKAMDEILEKGKIP